MKKNKVNLTELKLQSFVTQSLNSTKGGTETGRPETNNRLCITINIGCNPTQFPYVCDTATDCPNSGRICL